MSKMNWKKVIGWGVAALVVIGVVGTNMYSQQKQANSGKKNVYVVLPLTGAVAQLGQKTKQVMELWLTEHPNNKFNIIYVDSETSPSKAVSALNQKILSEDKPLVISALTGVSTAINPIVAQKNGFIYAISTVEIPHKNMDHIQRMSLGTIDVLVPLLNHAKKYKTVSVLYMDDDYGRRDRNSFVEAVRQNNAQVLSEESFPLNTLDIRNSVLKAIKDNPEAVFISGTATMGFMNVIKELQAMEYKGDILTGISFTNPHVQEYLGKYAENVITLTNDITAKSKETEIMEKALATQSIPMYFIPIETWNVLDLIQYTLEHNLPFNQETYTKMGKWKGVAGDVIFPGNGDSLYPFIMVQYKNGQFVPVESETK